MRTAIRGAALDVAKAHPLLREHPGDAVLAYDIALCSEQLRINDETMARLRGAHVEEADL